MRSRALDPSQLATAQRLQRQVLLLREIAERIGVSFEAVCLGLYGDNIGAPDAAPLTESTAARTDVPGKTTVRDALAQIGDVPVKAAEPPASPEVAFASTGDSIRTRVPAADSPAGTQAPPVDATAQAYSAIDAERLALAAEFHPAQRFKLVSPDGQTLHDNQRVLTRLSRFFWRGDGAALAKLRRAQPQWSALRPVPVDGQVHHAQN